MNDIDRIRTEHVVVDRKSPTFKFCQCCGFEWPCDAASLLAAVDERDKRIAAVQELAATGYTYADATKVVVHDELIDALGGVSFGAIDQRDKRIAELELTIAQMGLTISTWHERLAAIRKVLDRSQTGLTYIRDIYAAINGEATDA